MSIDRVIRFGGRFDGRFDETGGAPRNVRWMVDAVKLAKRAKTQLVHWHARRVAVRQLHAMPDWLLRDIGIERHQINDAVNHLGAGQSPCANNATAEKLAA